MDASEFTIMNLREMCRRKSLPIRGTKADMIKRLDDYDVDGTWRREIQFVGIGDETVKEGPNEQENPIWRGQNIEQQDEGGEAHGAACT